MGLYWHISHSHKHVILYRSKNRMTIKKKSPCVCLMVKTLAWGQQQQSIKNQSIEPNPVRKRMERRKSNESEDSMQCQNWKKEIDKQKKERTIFHWNKERKKKPYLYRFRVHCSNSTSVRYIFDSSFSHKSHYANRIIWFLSVFYKMFALNISIRIHFIFFFSFSPNQNKRFDHTNKHQ